jgi:hypothetical protein
MGAGQPGGDLIQGWAKQASGGVLKVGVELVQVPAQPADRPGALGDQLLAVVDQQLDLPGGRSWPAVGRSGSRSAARATARASIGSDLPRARTAWRAPAISHGGTRSTRSPAASRSRSSRPVTCRQSSTAHLRSSGQRRRAQPSSWPCPSVRAATVVWSSWRPAWSTATTVWVSLCDQRPAAPCRCLLPARGPWVGRRACLSWGAATLLSSHAGRPTTRP